MTSPWRSPWPQWRSHWHVAHAWPASAQVLVLCLFSLCFTGLVSALYSSEAWQAWWQAEEDTVAWQQSLQDLQTQVQAHQAQVRALQTQTHPSGLDLPAWQMQIPLVPAHDLRASWLQLAHTHGLQAPAQLDEGSAVWVGSLPQLLAAWQQLPQAVAQHAVHSFELSALPDSKLLQLSVTWLSWADSGTRVQTPTANAKALKVALPTPVTREASVLHNPFAFEGLRMALPDAASQGSRGGLRGVPLADVRWVGMLSQGGQAQALVAHAGLIRQLSLGQALGQDFGEVVQIAPDHVLLREWHANALGQWQLQTTRFPDKGPP